MNKLKEYKNKIKWDMWEDIRKISEEYCTNNSQRANNVLVVKKAQKNIE